MNQNIKKEIGKYISGQKCQNCPEYDADYLVYSKKHKKLNIFCKYCYGQSEGEGWVINNKEAGQGESI